MKDRVAQRQVFDLILRNDLLKLLLNVLPLVLAPEVVEIEKAAAREILAEARGLFGREIHETGFDDVEDWIIENAIVENLERFGARGDFQVCAGPLAQTDDEVVIGFGIVGGPSAAAVITAPAVAAR